MLTTALRKRRNIYLPAESCVGNRQEVRRQGAGDVLQRLLRVAREHGPYVPLQRLVHKSKGVLEDQRIRGS